MATRPRHTPVLPLRDKTEEIADAVIEYGKACREGRTRAQVLHFDRFLDLVFPGSKQRVEIVDIAALAPDLPPAA